MLARVKSGGVGGALVGAKRNGGVVGACYDDN